MSYFEWFETHANKHHFVIEKLRAKNYSPKEIIDYFVFENMVVCEPDFCLLYANKQKCHNKAYLNCFLCACPHFRFNDEGLRVEKGITCKSECSIQSKKSSWFIHDNVAHLDCSACIVPHTKAYITKHFDVDWKKIMKNCCVTSPKVSHSQ